MSKKQQIEKGQGTGDKGKGGDATEVRRFNLDAADKVLEVPLKGSAPPVAATGTGPVPPPATDDGAKASAAPCEWPPSRAFTIWTVEDAEPVLVVITRMASGRHVRCRLLGGEQMNLVCDVRKAENFRKDMEIRGAVLQPNTDGRVWKYGGVLPRRFGKW